MLQFSVQPELVAYLTYFIKIDLAHIEGPTQLPTELTFEAFCAF